jgi:hypothetical protein
MKHGTIMQQASLHLFNIILPGTESNLDQRLKVINGVLTMKPKIERISYKGRQCD